MKKKILIMFTAIFVLILAISVSKSDAQAMSYMSDKTELVVDLDVSGAESLAQTDDGFVWIGQYSGLTRYDSNEFITYKSFEDGGITYEILNVRALKQTGNVLFIMTYKNLFKYENNKFTYIDIGSNNIVEEIKQETNEDVSFQLYDLELNKTTKILYIATTIGMFVYDINLNKTDFILGTKNKKVNDIAVDEKNNKYYYQLPDGVYNEDDEIIYSNDKILDIYIYNETLAIGDTSKCYLYDLKTNSAKDTQYTFVDDQINKFLYDDETKTLYVGCENNKGLKNAVYIIDTQTGEYKTLNNISNNTQLVDMLVDYEKNLWVSSHNVSSSGVSIITKNALTNLLIDDPLWQEYENDANFNKQISAVERVGNTLYICSYSGVILYDLQTNRIVPNDGSKNAIMSKIEELGINTDIRDVEVFNGKIYLADYGSGLIEFDPTTNEINLYGEDFINDDNNLTITKKDETTAFSKASLLNVRCLRAFDDFLVIGYQNGGVIKFDGTSYKVFHEGKNVVFINKTSDGKVMFDQTKGLYIVNDDFTEITEYLTEKNVDGNRLKFLVDDDRVFYTLNSRLFYNYNNDRTNSKEIIFPNLKGSIVELNKIKTKDPNGNDIYKYIVASQSQIYITDALDDSNIDKNGRVIKYEVYDATNGLKPIAANTSGYYDEIGDKYYFQTTDGIFYYDFNSAKTDVIPIKIAISSVEVDGDKIYSNDFVISKNTNRLSFNLSVLAFRPNKGYKVYYKLEGVDSNYKELDEGLNSVSYTNLSGGSYRFSAYLLDEFGQKSNEVSISIVKPKKIHEQVWFWVFIVILGLALIAVLNFYIVRRNYKKAEKRQNEYKAITIESIEAIARTIDAKDKYTNGHSKRVGIYSRSIARALNLSKEEVDNIYYIALLHDIGKISIPLDILNKPGKLTDEEYEVMKSHTTAGGKILEGISTIPNIVAGAKYHHEKYDGSGYPQGLKGEEIPFIARIICCADCYDAMATKRTYKEPYTREKIISEFERCKGIQFDPHIADVVIELIKEDKLREGTELREASE